MDIYTAGINRFNLNLFGLHSPPLAA